MLYCSKKGVFSIAENRTDLSLVSNPGNGAPGCRFELQHNQVIHSTCNSRVIFSEKQPSPSPPTWLLSCRLAKVEISVLEGFRRKWHQQHQQIFLWACSFDNVQRTPAQRWWELCWAAPCTVKLKEVPRPYWHNTPLISTGQWAELCGSSIEDT